MFEIPNNYYDNLSCYEEFVLRTNILGYDISDRCILKKLSKVEKYYYIIIDGHLCFLNGDGTKAENVVIKGDLNISKCRLKSLKGCPKHVGGDFNCMHCELMSLEGCPEYVGGCFGVAFNHLTSLKGCPNDVGKSFICSHNDLSSLEYCPQTIHGSFCCDFNDLASLEGGPIHVGESFHCSHNDCLTSLEGCPKYVGGGTFSCSHCSKLTSLKGNLDLNSFSGVFCCIDCKSLTDVRDFPKMLGERFTYLIFKDECA